jgi:hypothetical protein
MGREVRWDEKGRYDGIRMEGAMDMTMMGAIDLREEGATRRRRGRSVGEEDGAMGRRKEGCLLVGKDGMKWFKWILRCYWYTIILVDVWQYIIIALPFNTSYGAVTSLFFQSSAQSTPNSSTETDKLAARPRVEELIMIDFVWIDEILCNCCGASIKRSCCR